jgi:hypothetical protein
MKFLCIECDQQMAFEERQQPGDGTFGAAFRCPKCNRAIALLANPMETQLVGSLGVKIGGRTLDEQPMELIRTSVVGKDEAFVDDEPSRPAVRPTWSPDAVSRLSAVPSFVRGMVKKIYAEYAAEHGIVEITPAIMDKARTDLGLEGM